MLSQEEFLEGVSGRLASKSENDFSSISSLAVGPLTLLILHS